VLLSGRRSSRTRPNGRGCGQFPSPLHLVGDGPALENLTQGRPMGESVFTRDCHAIVGVNGGDISGEDRGHAGEIKSLGKGVGMAQLPA